MASTARERQILRAILAAVEQSGYAPSVRELTEQLGIASTNGMIQHLLLLKRKGLIERETATARALRVTQLGLSELAQCGDDAGSGASPAPCGDTTPSPAVAEAGSEAGKGKSWIVSITASIREA